MTEARNPLPLKPDASINQVILHNLPGVTIDEGVRGRTAAELAGTPAVFDMIQANAAALRIPPALVAEPNIEAFIRLDRAFDSGDEKVRRAARDIARRFGRNLGYVLLALRHPDAVREDRPAWDAWMREYWWSLPRLWLGGGLIRGHLGKWAIPYIRGVFTEAGATPPDLMRDPYGAALPLVGAACCVPKGARGAAVLDFGGTSVKRGAAAYVNGALHSLQLLATLDTRWDPDSDDPGDPAALRRFLDEFMIPTIVDTFMQVHPDSWTIPVSMAAYIDEKGEPYPRRDSVYAALGGFTGNLQQSLSADVSRRIGRDIHVKLIHDGTAAATAHPGDTVMAIGTAIGIGYAPAVTDPRPVEASFAIK